MNKTFNIGDCVIAKNNINHDEGNISAIEESHGTKKGLLYKVNYNWYFAEDITLLDIERTPDAYWTDICSLRSQMVNEIYNLVIKYGKNTKGIYTMSLYNPKWGCYCYINNRGGNKPRLLTIKELVITQHEGSQVMGHIIMIDSDGNRYSFMELPNNEFNVYSHLFTILYRK